MPEHRQPGKLAVILHADVAGSTALVQNDEQLAHERILESFRRFGDTITKYHGHVRELRGDALLAEFERASDAVTAALAFQANQIDYIEQLNDSIQPTLRVGIAMGEVIIADDTITKYHGHVRELRGDALLAEFERASDAVTAALAFQAEQIDNNDQLSDDI